VDAHGAFFMARLASTGGSYEIFIRLKSACGMCSGCRRKKLSLFYILPNLTRKQVLLVNGGLTTSSDNFTNVKSLCKKYSSAAHYTKKKAEFKKKNKFKISHFRNRNRKPVRLKIDKCSYPEIT